MKIVSSKMESLLKFVAKRELEHYRGEMNVWTPSKKSRSENPDFRKELITFYQREDPNNHNNLICMVTNKSLPKEQVIASHIWKAASNGKNLDAFGLPARNVNTERNGFLAVKPIEDAFDDLRVCFVWNAMSLRLIFHVLDPTLSNVKVHPSLPDTFRAFHGGPLFCPPNAQPYKRLLGFHARLSFDRALQCGWISQVDYDQFVDYVALSTGEGNPIEAVEDALEQLLEED